MKQHNIPKWPQNSYIFLILEPIGTFVHCKRCSPPNMTNKMSLNSYLDHHICLLFQIWLHNNASWQKGHLIVHLAFVSWSNIGAVGNGQFNIGPLSQIFDVRVIFFLGGGIFFSVTVCFSVVGGQGKPILILSWRFFLAFGLPKLYLLHHIREKRDGVLPRCVLCPTLPYQW